MMRRSKVRRILLPILTAALISACGPQLVGQAPAGSSGPQAWFDAPLPGSSFPLGPVLVTAHGSDPAGIVAFEFAVNGAASALPSPDAAASLVTLSHTWNPDQPGTYTLSVRSANAAGVWSAPASTTVTILSLPTGSPGAPALTETPSPAAAPASSATPTSTPVPTSTATLTPPPAAGPAGIEIVGVSTNELTYGGTCGENQITIQARALDPVGITVVVMFYRVKSGGGDATDYFSKSMNPTGSDLYQVTINPESDFGINTLRPLGDGWFQYQAVIQNQAGETKTRTQVLSDVTIAPCAGGQQPPPPVIRPRPTATRTPIIIK